MIPTIDRKLGWHIKPFTSAQQRSLKGKPCWRKHFLTQARLGRSEGGWQHQEGSPIWQKVGAWIATATFAAALSATVVTQSVFAVTNEQLLFLEAWRAVDRAYYDKNFNGKPWFRIREQYMKDKQLNSRQETYAAIRSLLAELDDPFTRFLEPSRYAALKRGTAGSLTGVGLEVGFDMAAGSDSDLVVITPSADGPADKAGIKPRDQVVAIDGKATKGTSLYDAGELLQGPEGSQVTLTIKSVDEPDAREVQLMRQRIINNPVSSQLCQKVPLGEASEQPENFGKVGYIRVATFSKQTTDNVKTALHKLQAEKANMIVLDIRNNGGGLFPAGVEVARTLLNDGDIVLIADSQGVRDSYPASNVAVEASKPLSVLVNRGTASASEVLAGALQDNGRAKIVGETTFGKGLIQTIVELSDGSGVAVTVARYQTPLGSDINKKGIQPDILIDMGDMPPTSGPGFCKFVASKGAAVLFDAKAAAKMPKGGLEKRAEGTGESMSIDVTQYENAFISGQPSDSQASQKEPETPPLESPSKAGQAGETSSSDQVPKEPDSSREGTESKGSANPENDSKDSTTGRPETEDSPSTSGDGTKSKESANAENDGKDSTTGGPKTEDSPSTSGDGAKSKGSTNPENDSKDSTTGGPKPEGSPSGDAPDQKEAPTESQGAPPDAPIADRPAPVEDASQQAQDKIAPSPSVIKNSQQPTKAVVEDMALGDSGDQSLELQGDQEFSNEEAVLMNVPFIPSETLTVLDSEDMLLNEEEMASSDALPTV